MDAGNMSNCYVAVHLDIVVKSQYIVCNAVLFVSIFDTTTGTHTHTHRDLCSLQQTCPIVPCVKFCSQILAKQLSQIDRKKRQTSQNILTKDSV